MPNTIRQAGGKVHPLTLISVFFVAWKALLLLVASSSPGIGYDTSTTIRLQEPVSLNSVSSVPSIPSAGLFKLVRWDAIYYTHMSDEGHIFEQEWAFGIGLSTAISWVARALSWLANLDRPVDSGLAGVLLAHVAHWLAVVLLWAVALRLTRSNPEASSVPLHAAILHIISPAGIFLSAPQSESLFAAFSMAGYLAYIYAKENFRDAEFLMGACGIVGAGLYFGLATVIRSNGILFGLVFLFEAGNGSLAILTRRITAARLVHVAATVIGGSLVGIGMLVPQAMAYQEYCAGRNPGERRRWCEHLPPSIFTWVQSHYWNVGFLRYWTLSNVPLFMIATPVLAITMYSSYEVLFAIKTGTPSLFRRGSAPKPTDQWMIVLALAVPQFVLAALALTSYHVQIITRLSSGYPLWYIWLAARLQAESKQSTGLIRFMVLYALIQAGLYASFLPPA